MHGLSKHHTYASSDDHGEIFEVTGNAVIMDGEEAHGMALLR